MSHIEVSPHVTTFVGEDATRLFAATVLRGAIRLYVKSGIKVSSAYTPTAMAFAASGYTGKTYKRSQLDKALVDLSTWIETVKANLSVEIKGAPNESP